MPRHSAVLLTALCVLPACGARRAPDIVLVVVDTLRADRLGCYGNARGLTPFLDSLAARGVVFRNAYAPAPWTNPSVASLLTSRFPSQHGAVAFESVLADAEVTFPEVLREAGYRTGAFSANGGIQGGLGYGQGFQHYRAHLPVARAGVPLLLWLPLRGDAINDEALGWLDRDAPGRDAPVFLYVQYMETHQPYDPLPEYLQRVAGEAPPPDVETVNALTILSHIQSLQAEDVRAISEVYDAEVASVDLRIRDLFAALERRQLLRNALVIVTADHGEEFNEHGVIGHGMTLYNPALHVPLIVVVPDGDRHGEVEEVVSLVDLAPTILHFAGIAPPPAFEGRSLAPLLADPRRGDAGFAYSQRIPRPMDASPDHPHTDALVVGPQKLIVGMDGDRETYRLDRDPEERHTPALDDGERVALERRLDALGARARQAVAERREKPLDEQTKEKLRALGYLQ
jgi:arylsulfatase A-like enzyme